MEIHPKVAVHKAVENLLHLFLCTSSGQCVVYTGHVCFVETENNKHAGDWYTQIQE